MHFERVCCDWMTGKHTRREAINPRDSGRILRISSDGEIEYEQQLWDHIKCASSDTSLRIRDDGRTVRFMGNIGRFQQADNVTGITVLECVEKWAKVLSELGYGINGFGTRFGRGTIVEHGTVLTRIDLAGNFEVSDYSALASAMMVRRIGQRLPSSGRYGPTWGYESKRSNWFKAKLYDKTAEQQGKRRSGGGATLARFEVQLGSEWLKREKLDEVMAWKDEEMAQIIYGKFANPVFRDSLQVQEWGDMPLRLQAFAVMWRDGIDLRTVMSQSAYYRARTKLMDYGIDIGTACNVMALTRHCRIVEVTPVSALRHAA